MCGGVRFAAGCSVGRGGRRSGEEKLMLREPRGGKFQKEPGEMHTQKERVPI